MGSRAWALRAGIGFHGTVNRDFSDGRKRGSSGGAKTRGGTALCARRGGTACETWRHFCLRNDRSLAGRATPGTAPAWQVGVGHARPLRRRMAQVFKPGKMGLPDAYRRRMRNYL
jgi:hypothetical protein